MVHNKAPALKSKTLVDSWMRMRGLQCVVSTTFWKVVRPVGEFPELP